MTLCQPVCLHAAPDGADRHRSSRNGDAGREGVCQTRGGEWLLPFGLLAVIAAGGSPGMAW
jgi:hypothetical protein